jgi:pSer/pThr/pTyr-binding forkhead associated (FHA) protein
VRARVRDGELFDLARPVLIGRNPSLPRIRRGPEPRLVTVPSPAKEVSATHLELRMHGAAVVASDMRSTNGTTVVLPGGRSRTLLRGESAVLPPGSTVELGDGVVVEILSIELDGAPA